MAAFRRRSVALPPPIAVADSWFGDSKLMRHVATTHRGTFLTNIREANGRNRRTVWSIPTEPFLGAHFATFPPKLVEPCVLAGSRPDDWGLDPFFGRVLLVSCVSNNRESMWG
jgi:DNA modification methylase